MLFIYAIPPPFGLSLSKGRSLFAWGRPFDKLKVNGIGSGRCGDQSQRQLVQAVAGLHQRL